MLNTPGYLVGGYFCEVSKFMIIYNKIIRLSKSEKEPRKAPCSLAFSECDFGGD